MTSYNNYNDYANKGLSGLVNLGNTCYLNSCMQILSHCYILNKILDDSINNNKLNNVLDSALVIEWNNLRKILWSKNCIVSPNRYIHILQKFAQKKNKELFTGFIQNDFPEFLIFILESFHNGVKRNVNMKIKGTIKNDMDKLAKSCYNTLKLHFDNNFSDIIDNFYGVQVSQILSIDSNLILSHATDPYCLVSLSLTNNTNTIYDCFDEYCKDEILKDDNAWFNDSTKKYQDVKKNIRFWNLPKILIIDLKRFDNNQNKLIKHIDVPLENLDLSKYVIGYNSNESVYNLFAVSNHIGTYYGGHYTAYIKNANKKWYEFNDEKVSNIDKKKVITNNAYSFFFYKK